MENKVIIALAVTAPIFMWAITRDIGVTVVIGIFSIATIAGAWNEI